VDFVQRPHYTTNYVSETVFCVFSGKEGEGWEKMYLLAPLVKTWPQTYRPEPLSLFFT
jgi:hypothetical protein